MSNDRIPAPKKAGIFCLSLNRRPYHQLSLFNSDNDRGIGRKSSARITTLSRDVEHSNNALSPIFNKEKEQKRLKQAQLIGEIGAQLMDIVRTEGELKTQKAAEAKGDATVEGSKDG
ncbi:MULTISPECIES: hypothetical protein [Pectobacterium]|uniref:hypothetical protein n=1 Tax=Pectobacterium TaxID=122277 RepID=UPI001F11C0DF|nr:MULTISPECIES: hypothetical protein [Pectobacterium]